LIHDLIKPRKFNYVTAVWRGISSALPRWTAEFTKLAAEFVKFCRWKLRALMIMLSIVWPCCKIWQSTDVTSWSDFLLN